MRNSVSGNKIVIIGSGIGGLAAGIILLQLNYSVTIVEKNPLPGGLMRSYRRSGLDCPVGVHYVGALGEDEPLGRIFRQLGVSVQELFEKMGQGGIIDRYIFDDFVFDLPAGIDVFENNLRSSVPGDTAAIDFILKNLREIAGRMMEPSFLVNQGDPFQNVDYFQPMGEVLDKLQASARLRAVLAVPPMLIGVPLNDCPVIFHHMLLAGYLLSSWRLKESGSKMADVFVRRFEELGGKIILNTAAKKILSENNKITGLELESGIVLPADAIVAAIHPKALLALLGDVALRDSFRQRILNLQETEGIIAAQISVEAASHPEIKHNIYELKINEKGEIRDGLFYQLRSGRKGFNLLSIITRSLYSEWREWENTVSGRRGSDYAAKKIAIAQNLLQKVAEKSGPFKNARIVDVFTPLTLRDYVNCPEGACYGLIHSAAQLLKIASINNFPAPGIFLAGQNVVAPGILGSILGSLNAVRQIVGGERFGKEIKW